jgi:predicted transcriptional regulator
MSEERKIELLEELVKWVKVTSIPKVKELLEIMLLTSKEKIAYKYSDGERTIREVSQLSGRDIGTISRDWKRWERAGIAVSVSAKRGYRAKSLFSLEDFGIDTLDITSAVSKKLVLTKENTEDQQSVEGDQE